MKLTKKEHKLLVESINLAFAQLSILNGFIPNGTNDLIIHKLSKCLDILENTEN